MCLWVAPVEAICSGMMEPVGNNMPTYTTVCLDYSNEIVLCISTCPSGQHLSSHELVCDFPLRKCVVRQRRFETKCASVSHVAHAEVQSLCQERTENSGCDVKCIEEYTIASHTSVERHYLDTVTYICKSGYSLNGLRYGKKEFFLGCKSDGTYDVPHLTCQLINCILEDAPTAKVIEFSGHEWLKYQFGEGHTLSGIPDSSDPFTVTCLDDDHTMTHCKPVQCGEPPVIAHATPFGGCSVTITYRKQVTYQREAGYHVESGHKSGSKPEGCHAKERAEPEQPAQAPEEPVSAVSIVDTSIRLRRDLLHGSVSRIGLSRTTNGWRTGAAPGATKCLSGQFSSRALQAGVRPMPCVSSPDMSGEPSWSVTCEK